MFRLDKTELKKLVRELEVEINETDELIKKAWLASEMMVEPIKSQFTSDLKLRESQLKANKIMLESFKLLLVKEEG